MSLGLQLARNKWYFSRVMGKRWYNVDMFCYKSKVNASLNREVIMDRGEQRDTELPLHLEGGRPQGEISQSQVTWLV